MADLMIPPAAMIRALVAQRLTLHLATNASWTELRASGYQARVLRWTEGDGSAQAAPESFRFGGPSGTVYGYFVTDADGTVLVREPITDERGDPVVIRVAGDEVIVTPRLVAKG